MSELELRRSNKVVFRGVYIARNTVLTTAVLAEAALRIAPPQSFISHHTAARLWGGIVPHHPDVHVTFTGVRAQAAGIAAHRRKRSQVVVRRGGLRVTSPLQTFLDLAHVLDLVDLVVLGDSLVRRKRFTVEQLCEAASSVGGPHSRRARRAASLVRKGVDSAMETRLRLLIVFAGLPEPEVDHRVFDADGRLLRRYDLSYLPFRLIIEYDGRQHADSDEQWLSDIQRDEQLDDERIRRLVIVSRDIYNTPEATLGRITRAMRRQGMEASVRSDEWRRHFPGRATTDRKNA